MTKTDHSTKVIHLLIVGTVCMLVFMVFLGKTPFHDKGELREALVVRDIVLEGRWLFPLRSGEKIPSKPPLFHWFAAIASMARGEITEATVRFPSALFASLGVFLCYSMGKRLVDSQTGLWAALILSTTAIYYAVAMEARVDMTLAFFVTLSLVLFTHSIAAFCGTKAGGTCSSSSPVPVWTAKGPVSVVLCGLVIGSFLIARRRWDFLKTLLRHPGIVVGIVACLAWYGVALYFGGSEFFGLQFVKENFARFFVRGEGGTGHQKPIYYFIPYLFTLGLPWTLFLPALLWSYFRDGLFRRDEMLYLGLWVAVVFIFFSLSAGKRPPYILPLYPALALLTAFWLRGEVEPYSWKSRYYKGVCMLSVVIGSAFAALLALQLAGADFVRMLQTFGVRFGDEVAAELSMVSAALRDSRWLVPGFLLASMLLWFSAGRNFYRLKVPAAVIQLASVYVLAFVFGRGFILPTLATTGSYKDFVQFALDKVDDRQSLIVYPQGIEPSSIIFYGQDKVKVLPEDPSSLPEGLGNSKDYFIVQEDLWNSRYLALSSKIPVLGRSRGTGPGGEGRLVLIQGEGQ
jgi:4-amino-4-deoxy-L-arabinose transferase-like glycosyltransferase